MTVIEYIQRLWRASEGFRFRIIQMTVTGMVSVCASLFFVYITKRLVDIATGTVEGSIMESVALMIGCMALQLLIWTVDSWLETQYGLQLDNKLRYQLFNRLMVSRWYGKEKFHSGDMISRLDSDVGQVSGIISYTVPAVIITLFQLVFAFIYLCTMDVGLAWILVFVMPVAVLTSKLYMHRMRTLNKEIRKTDSRLQEHIQESLLHRTLIRTLEYTPGTVLRMGNLQKQLYDQVRRRTDFGLFSRGMVQTGFDVSYVVAFLWGIRGLTSGEVTFGMMTAFLQLVAMVQSPIVSLSRQIPAFVRALISMERIAELEAVPMEQEAKSVRLQGPVGIRLNDVDFTYPEGSHKILNEFSFDFLPGSRTALMGETGVGKSTLIRLMLALLQPDKGTIGIYNEKREVRVSVDTRCNMVYVPQGNTLLSGTVRDNLLMGKPDATEEEMGRALHTAAADFVFGLSDGLDTLCGEQGAGLSEGQAQRIAIARGLLRPGGLLLLDEPTSSLDEATEKLLLERLMTSVCDKTFIIVTHRETVLQWCTHVLRLKKISNQLYY